MLNYVEFVYRYKTERDLIVKFCWFWAPKSSSLLSCNVWKTSTHLSIDWGTQVSWFSNLLNLKKFETLAKEKRKRKEEKKFRSRIRSWNYSKKSGSSSKKIETWKKTRQNNTKRNKNSKHKNKKLAWWKQDFICTRNLEFYHGLLYRRVFTPIE